MRGLDTVVSRRVVSYTIVSYTVVLILLSLILSSLILSSRQLFPGDVVSRNFAACVLCAHRLDTLRVVSRLAPKTSDNRSLALLSAGVWCEKQRVTQ